MRYFKIHITVLSAILLTSLSSSVIAQNRKARSVNQYGDTITIVGQYTPTISDAVKIKFNPDSKTEPAKDPISGLEYSIQSKKIETLLDLEKIDYTVKDDENLSKLFRNYIKAGFGNYTTPYFDFFITPTRNTETQFGLNIKHISSLGDVDKEYAKSAYSKSSMSVFAKKFNKNNTLSGVVNYSRNTVHYYGFKPDEILESFTDDDIKQTYQNFGTILSIESNEPDPEDFNYSLAMTPYYFTNSNSSSEAKFGLNTKLQKGLELIDDKITIAGLKAEFDYYFNKDSVASNNLGLASLNPYLNIDFGQYLLKIGMTAGFEIDTNSKANIFPDIEGQLKIVPGSLTAFAGIGGGIKYTGFKSLALENPYIASVLPLKYYKNKYEIFGGITGNIDKIIDFTLRLSNSSIENLPMFVSDTSLLPLNIFNVIYDNASLTSANIEIGYHYAEKIRFSLAILLNSYSMDNEEKAWQRPGIQSNLEANYNVSNRFLLKLALIGYDKQYAKVFENNKVVAKEIKGYMDLNLGIEFRYTPGLSFWLDLNNITGQQYQKWYNYPSQKLNFLAGLSYSF